MFKKVKYIINISAVFIKYSFEEAMAKKIKVWWR